MNTSNNKLKVLYKYITANMCAIWQRAAHTTDQLTSFSCCTVAIQKAYLLTKNMYEFSEEKKVRTAGQQAEEKR